MAVPEDSGYPCSLYRLSPDGAVTELFGGVGLSDGLDWTADRRVFYYSDSHAGVDVFDTDPDTGALGARRRFAEVSGGLPDGLTLDAEGGLWLAVWGSSGQLRRYAPDGRLNTVVKLPVSQVTSAAFGGPDLSTLYITTASKNFTPARTWPPSRTPATYSPAPPASPGARHTCSMPDLTTLLDRYRPAGDAETADLKRVRALLESGADPYRRRSAAARHRVGADRSTRPPAGSCFAGTSASRPGLPGRRPRRRGGDRPVGHRRPGGGEEETGLTDLVPWPDAEIKQVVIVDVPPGKAGARPPSTPTSGSSWPPAPPTRSAPRTPRPNCAG